MAKTKVEKRDRDLMLSGIKIVVERPKSKLQLVGALMGGEGPVGVRKLDRVRVGLYLAVQIATSSQHSRRRAIEVLAQAWIRVHFEADLTARQSARIEPMYWQAIRELKAEWALRKIMQRSTGRSRAQLAVLLMRAGLIDSASVSETDIPLAYKGTLEKAIHDPGAHIGTIDEAVNTA